jgi:hypothetical protein
MISGMDKSRRFRELKSVELHPWHEDLGEVITSVH